MSYSQGDEERYILSAVGAQPARFLDIGAFHPTTLSNTRALYERGWNGVMVEPSPLAMSTLLEAYGKVPGRITLIQAALDIRQTLVELKVNAFGVSTTLLSHYQKWKDRLTFAGLVMVPTITWDTLLEMFDDYGFVNIDTEGASAMLLSQMLTQTKLRPQCCCVEHDDIPDELAILAAANGYHELYRNENNLVVAL